MDDLLRFRALIANNATAVSYQNMAQYRSMLLNELDKIINHRMEVCTPFYKWGDKSSPILYNFWYDINFGENILPEEIVTDPTDLSLIMDAIDVLASLEQFLERGNNEQ